LKWRIWLIPLLLLLTFMEGAPQTPSPPLSKTPRPQEPSTLKVAVDLVLINVTVVDDMNRFVMGLEKEHFEVLDEKVPQKITTFGREEVPVSMGILFDVSGSMSFGVSMSRQIISTLLEISNQSDEFSLFTFAAAPKLKEDFTSDIAEIQNRVAYENVKGCTSLLDAVYLGLAKMKRAHNPKQALILVSDGGENCSRYSLSNVKRALQESEVQVFAVTTGSGEGYDLLKTIAESTGGSAYPPFADILDTCTKVALELRNQYVLGYVPSNPTPDGRWHRVRVKVKPPRGMPRLYVRAKQGYYAISQ
jgi:Ca-activated chloride channel family protein